MKAEGSRIRLYFDHTAGGLICKGKELSCFTIAGSDRNFMKAKAIIEGDTIVVENNDVREPVAVRFAWSNIAEPNLFNTAGLPASPFRTDDFNGITFKVK
jgi:sialate O-acetylesterase